MCTSCPDGKYLEFGACNDCSEGCLRCAGSYDTCTACSDEYYLEGGKCVPCKYPCVTCVTETFCLTCGDDYIFRTFAPGCNCLKEYQDGGSSCI